jgi:Domain of unknown function (DUF5615)
MLEPTLHLFIALYTDEDVTADLAPALRLRGYIAQSTAEAGNTEISDEAQLIYAAEQDMAILTYNTRLHLISSYVVRLRPRACWYYRLRTVQPETVR